MIPQTSRLQGSGLALRKSTQVNWRRNAGNSDPSKASAIKTGITGQPPSAVSLMKALSSMFCCHGPWPFAPTTIAADRILGIIFVVHPAKVDPAAGAPRQTKALSVFPPIRRGAFGRSACRYHYGKGRRRTPIPPTQLVDRSYSAYVRSAQKSLQQRGRQLSTRSDVSRSPP